MPPPPPVRGRKSTGAGGEPVTLEAPTRVRVEPPHEVSAPEPEGRLAQAEALLETLSSELARHPPASRAGRLHYECARLFEGPLSDSLKAAEHYQRALELLPEYLPALQGARRALIQKKQHQAALPLFDAEARLVQDVRHKARLLLEKAVLLDDQMGLKREAHAALATALELDKSDPSLLKAMERAERQMNAWAELDRTLDLEANAVRSDARHRSALLAERARLLETKRNEGQLAAELYQNALSTDAGAPGALSSLKRLQYTQHRFRDLISTLEIEAAQVADPNARALCFYQIGRVAADRLGNVDEAIAALERAVSEVPNDAMVVEELARLYELNKRYDVLSDALERLAEISERPQEKLGYHHRVGQILEEQLKDPERAVAAYEKALAIQPNYLPALSALQKLYTERKQWGPLIAMHLREAQAAPDGQRRAAAHARVAEIFEAELGDANQAIAHHARALGLVRGFVPAFKALARLYSDAGKFRELVELYERAVEEASDPETKLLYLFKIGRTQEDALRAPDQALTAYKRALALEPKNVAAIHAWQRAAERAKNYPELAEALKLEAETLRGSKPRGVEAPRARSTDDKHTIAALLQRAAEVTEQHLDDVDTALSLFKQVLEVDEAYGPTLSSLGRLYHRLGRWEDVLAVYRRELKITPKGPERAALELKLGELCELRLGRDDEAIQAYRATLEIDPVHGAARRALDRKLSERGRWSELAELLEKELSQVQAPEERARVAFRLGQVLENRLQRLEQALGAYEQALSAAPDFKPALDARTRLLAQSKEWRKLTSALAQEVERASDPSSALAALLLQGEVLRDQLGDAPKAAQCFEGVLERDPGHLGALLHLEPLYTELGNWESLANVYATEARVLTDPRGRVAALRELARLREKHGLGSPEELRQTYFAILQLEPDDLGALSALERIALRDGDPELLSHVDAKLGVASKEPSLIAAYHTRLAEALEDKKDPAALDIYRAALQNDPEAFAAVRGVARWAEQTKDAKLLEEAAEREASVSLDRETAARLFVSSAAIRAEAGEVDRAAKALERALEIDPDSELAAHRLFELLLSRGKVDRLLDRLTHAAQNAVNRERSAALQALIAELYADRKNDLPAALAALNRVQNQIPGHVPTLLKLAELYARDGQWAEAVDRYTQLLGQKPDPELAVNVELRLAAILDEHLGDPGRAVKNLEAVLQTDPQNRPALKRLLSHQRRRDQKDAAAETAARLVRASPEREARAEALTLWAELERARAQPDAAAQAYEQAVALVGFRPGVTDSFKQMLLDQKHKGLHPAWGRYVAALGRYLEQPGVGEKDTGAVYLEMARVSAEELRQPDQALSFLTEGLKRLPDDGYLRLELAAQLRKKGRFVEAVTELERVLGQGVVVPQVFRDLAESYSGLERHPEATLAIGPLVALGQANELEAASYGARPIRAGVLGPGSFPASELSAIDPSPGPDRVTDLLNALSDVLGKLHPPDLERYGLGSRDRIGSRSNHPLRVLADRAASAFGIQEYDLYPHRAHSGALEVEFSDPISILVPAHIANLTEPQQIFLLARVMANIARGVAAVDKLALPELEAVLVSAAREVDPTFGSGNADEGYLSGQARRLHKSLSWLRRGAVEDAARRYVNESTRDLASWLRRTRRLAARAAVIVSDDLPGAVVVLRQSEGDLAGLQGEALAQGMELVNDLLRFWVSPEAHKLRRRLGLL